MIRTAATFLVILCLSQIANAQCRIVRGGRFGIRQTSCNFVAAPVVVQQQVVRHSYYANQAYVAPVVARNYAVQKIVTQDVALVAVPVVTYAVPIQAYNAAHYYSVQESYQQKATIRDVIREELRAFMGNAAPNTPSTPARQPAPGSPPLYSKEKPADAKKATDLGKDATTPKEIADPVIKAFKDATCLNCHNGTQVKGGLRLTYEEGGVTTLAKQTPERRWVVYGQASTGVMPLEARNDATKAMKQEDLPSVLRWVLQTD